MKLCEYGCGQQAHHQFKNGKWCCESDWTRCPFMRKTSSERLMGRVLWNKGKTEIFREEVLKRANYKCEYCGDQATHVHHSRPQKLEPFFSLDPDFGISCCEECSTGQLANRTCL